MTHRFLRLDAPDPVARLLLAHGAGAPMDSDFMNALAAALAKQGISTLRFEFPYMAARRGGAGKRPPDRAPVLLDCWREAFERAREKGGDLPLLVGGKSMGGRMASLVADELGVAGLCCYGYPFHPPGRTDKLRTEHLLSLVTSALILQGTRDPFGKPALVDGLALSASVRVHWLDDGDHDFKPRKASGLDQEALIGEDAVATRNLVLSR